MSSNREISGNRMSVDGEDARTPSMSVPPTPGAAPTPVDEYAGLDDAAKAEKIKEKGNVAFKAARYADAITSYSQSIGAPASRM
jgi:DnaJ family protein C protein 7